MNKERKNRLAEFAVKRILLLFITLGVLIGEKRVFAYTPYDSYTYSNATGTIEAIPTPAPYIPADYINSDRIGTELSRPCDFAFGPDGNLYVVDSNLNKIVVLNRDFKVVKEIKSFKRDSKDEGFNNPQGLFVDSTGQIYVCDTGNGRVLMLNNEGELISVYTKPDSPLLGADYEYKPVKIAVDSSGTLYVINTNEYSGIMKITPQGRFVGFIGSNKAIVSPVVKFWKKIMSETQKKQLLSFVPVEYHNISMDSEGFIYAVSATKSGENPIRRLNLSGTDILIRNGYVGVKGDLVTPKTITKDTKSGSVFVDICSSGNGNYFALDSNYGRIFVYNQEGFLLYVFGGRGVQIGTFTTPSAIELQDDRLLVLDEVNAAITVFKKTQFANLISQAEQHYYQGNFEQSKRSWNEVLKLCSTYEFGYLQLGKIYLQEKDYFNAMRCFKLGNYRGDKVTFMTGYNKAYTEIRKIWFSKYLAVMVLGGLALAVIVSAYRRFVSKRRKKQGEGHGKL